MVGIRVTTWVAAGYLSGDCDRQFAPPIPECFDGPAPQPATLSADLTLFPKWRRGAHNPPKERGTFVAGMHPPDSMVRSLVLVTLPTPQIPGHVVRLTSKRQTSPVGLWCLCASFSGVGYRVAPLMLPGIRPSIRGRRPQVKYTVNLNLTISYV